MSQVEVDKIIPQSGTTLTIGDSGDTITIPSGVTLSNSGIITNFESTGIDDNATSTAITIDSSENVGIGTASPDSKLQVSAGTNLNAKFIQLSMDNAIDEGIGITFSRTSSDTPVSAIGITEIDEFTLASREGIKFFTGGGVDYAATSEAMCIDSSGNVGIGTGSPSQKLDVVGSIEVSDGIYIGGTTSANLLDDYEEGTWTPEYEPATGSPFTSITYDFRHATYTKIGRQVTCLLAMRTSALTKGTASGAVDVTGLPFTIGSAQNLRTYYPVGIGSDWINNPSNLRGNHTTSTARIQENFANAATEVSDMSTGGANNFIALEFTYFTD